MTFGDEFTLPVGGTKVFKLMIWLSNFDYDQFDLDGGGSYNAIVTFESTDGSEITGSISNS